MTRFRFRERTWCDTFVDIFAIIICIAFFVLCWAALVWLFSVTTGDDDVKSQKNMTGCLKKSINGCTQKNITLYFNVTYNSVSNISTTEATTNVSSDFINNEYDDLTLSSVSNISTTEAVTNESSEYSYDEDDSTTLDSVSNISNTEVATTNVSSELFQNEYS